MWIVNRSGKPITILMADDDADDRFLAQEALHEARLRNELRYQIPNIDDPRTLIFSPEAEF